MNNNIDKLNSILKICKINEKEKDEILSIIMPIFMHEEFQKRMTNSFMHHGTTTLGEHILYDTVLTYKLSKKYIRRHPNKKYNLEYALKISMMHDLYTIQYQNSGIIIKKFFHKHGFTHPVEAVINAGTWFKEEFNDNKKRDVLIDSIVHHMYPLPVISFYETNTNEFELKNFNLIKDLDVNIKLALINSCKRHKLGQISFARSKYKEGKIMSRADKLSSLKQIKTFSDFIALFTGVNNSLNK